MNIIELKNITENLLKTFLIAGQKAMELRSKGLKIMIKFDNTPVTNGDLEVDRLLRKRIIQITPNIPLISEETVNLNKKNNFLGSARTLPRACLYPWGAMRPQGQFTLNKGPKAQAHNFPGSPRGASGPKLSNLVEI